MITVRYKIIKIKKIQSFFEKNKQLMENYDHVSGQQFAEENNLLSAYGFKDIDEMYKSNRKLYTPVLKGLDIPDYFPSIHEHMDYNDGFLILGWIPETLEIVFMATVAEIVLEEYFFNQSGNVIKNYAHLLSSLGVGYNFRSRRFCRRILDIVIRKCRQFYESGDLYSEILESNLKSVKCHRSVGFEKAGLPDIDGHEIYKMTF